MAEIREMTALELEQAVRKGIVLAEFYLPWCGPCRMLGEVMRRTAPDLPAGVVIGKINIDAEPALAARFNVMTVPYLILFRDGEKKAEAAGMQSRSALLGLFEL